MTHSYEETLRWFGSVIEEPLDQESHLISSRADNSSHYIKPSPSLQPSARIEIYAQQYWWRLFKIMQNHYPVITRLFGYDGFNQQIVTPYIMKNRPKDWNINLLGHSLAAWIEEFYHEPDKPLVLACAQFEWGFVNSFLEKSSLPPTSPDEKLYLTPTTYLYEFKWDLLNFRKAILEHDPNHWVDQPFPPLLKEKTYRYVLRRTIKGNIKVGEIEEEEFKLLLEFRKGLSLNDLCKKNPQNLPLKDWIARWVTLGLLTRESPPLL